MKASVVAEFSHSAQMERGMNTMGASVFRRHLEHFPRASICPHKEDYCDKCKALRTDTSQCRFVIKKINESGNATAEKLQPHEKELAALLKEQQEHLKDAKLAREFYTKMVAQCKEQWTTLSTAEGTPSRWS